MDGVAVYETGGRNSASCAKYHTVRHYGRNYRAISEKSNVVHSAIESRYGGNRFTVVVWERNGNFFKAPTVHWLFFQICEHVQN